MTKLRSTLSAVALSGALLVTSAAPAIADSAPTGATSEAAAAAKVTKKQKLAKLKTLTLNSNNSTLKWFEALGQHRQKKQAIRKYKFNWKTDYCSMAPNKVAGGYSFTDACYRHDFGYRNYKSVVGKYYFKKNHKSRIDKAFLRDMNTACTYKPWADPYTPAQRKKLKAACKKTAKKYYQAVVALG
ncbi:hypothetical protein SUDANB148_02820 [Streptomyces sp. SudanB148_2056]|uniref:Phospholipase A2 n=1 Tax=Streptomyces variabilis TaxID=67372 RepID=A0ABQ2TYI8_9ACTN|nr:phospholipase A2 [Streptomyces sp. TRM75561]MDH3036844.1 phospholipase A2 [Streptomyces sp. TRM75561]GGP57908.1 hypothetical protein GCM10010265_39810 [Streptomyces griseoincarnatus]GGT54382.1 hypothetical protein GCM10010287_30620 [Streptomyces variabilis]